MAVAPSPTQSANNKPGLVAAWALKFSHEDPATHALASTPAPVTLSSNDYDGDFDVTLPSGFSGGTYAITLYDLSQDDYDKIKTANGANRLDVVELYLFYADNLTGPSIGAKAGAYFSNLIGLASAPNLDHLVAVADLRLTGVKRSVFLPPAASSGGGGGGSSAGSGSSGGSSLTGSSGGSSGGASSGSSAGGGASSGAPSGAGGGSSGGGGSSSPSSTPLRRPTIKFELKVEERIYSILHAAHRSSDSHPQPATSLKDAVKEFLENQAHLPSANYRFWPTSSEQSTHVSFQLASPVSSQLAELALPNGQLERANQKYCAGRGMLLIRNGVLHVGKRNIPLAGDPLDLTAEMGLLETSVADTANSSGPEAPKSGGGRPTHRQLTLTLRGRPDIKPGDFVRFKLPTEDENVTAMTSSSLGALAAVGDIISGLTGIPDETPNTGMYVDSVRHQLGRRTGFQTTLTGLEFNKDQPMTAWELFGHGTRITNAPSGANAAAGAVRGASAQSSAANAQSSPEVAEVRGFTAVDPTPSQTSPHPDPNGQTESVWVGLEEVEELQPNPVRRLSVDHLAKVQATGVPYLTPFAFGKCGLVLPRYPKMRVLLAYRKGDQNDPVDIGSLWQSGHIPPNAAMGDWWLSLPANTHDDPSSSAPDDDDASPPADYSGKISQDLTDARGRRAIDVSTLRIRACSDTLEDVGTKIVPAPDGSALVIEHTKNGKTASITIKDDSSIEISSDTKITFTSQGDIEMHAANVKVYVSGKMNVAS